MQLSQAYGGFRPTFHTGEPRLRIQECAVSPPVRTLRDVLLAEEGRHVPLDGRFELLLRHRTRRPARRNARIPDKFRNAPMRDRNVAALTAIDRRTRLVPNPCAFNTHRCPASEPLLARAFCGKRLLLNQATFLPVSILTIEFPGPEQRGETQRWRGKIQWIGRIQPKELPMKSFLIAALSATTISALAAATPVAAQADAPGAPKGTAPVTIEGYGPSSAIVCDQAGTTCWHSVDRYDSPANANVVVHPYDWQADNGAKYSWREHTGRGYWMGDQWQAF